MGSGVIVQVQTSSQAVKIEEESPASAGADTPETMDFTVDEVLEFGEAQEDNYEELPELNETTVEGQQQLLTWALHKRAMIRENAKKRRESPSLLRVVLLERTISRSLSQLSALARLNRILESMRQRELEERRRRQEEEKQQQAMQLEEERRQALASLSMSHHHQMTRAPSPMPEGFFAGSPSLETGDSSQASERIPGQMPGLMLGSDLSSDSRTGSVSRSQPLSSSPPTRSPDSSSASRTSSVSTELASAAASAANIQAADGSFSEWAKELAAEAPDKPSVIFPSTPNEDAESSCIKVSILSLLSAPIGPVHMATVKALNAADEEASQHDSAEVSPASHPDPDATTTAEVAGAATSPPAQPKSLSPMHGDNEAKSLNSEELDGTARSFLFCRSRSLSTLGSKSIPTGTRPLKRRRRSLDDLALAFPGREAKRLRKEILEDAGLAEEIDFQPPGGRPGFSRSVSFPS